MSGVDKAYWILSRHLKWCLSKLIPKKLHFQQVNLPSTNAGGTEYNVSISRLSISVRFTDFAHLKSEKIISNFLKEIPGIFEKRCECFLDFLLRN